LEFQETGSVLDKPKVGHLRTSSDDESSMVVLARTSGSSLQSARKTATEIVFPKICLH
jgi:hypothetical protein